MTDLSPQRAQRLAALLVSQYIRELAAVKA
jgi:hypothetical protein